eukprot:4656487-Amphidinium_carterae.1
MEIYARNVGLRSLSDGLHVPCIASRQTRGLTKVMKLNREEAPEVCKFHFSDILQCQSAPTLAFPLPCKTKGLRRPFCADKTR